MFLPYFRNTGIEIEHPNSPAALLDEQSGEHPCGGRSGPTTNKCTSKGRAGIPHDTPSPWEPDLGYASRFYYIAKASPAERDNFVSADPKEAAGCLEGRHDGSLDGSIPRRKCLHPTVKPIDLMRYLCRLVTPPGGIVLDPFAGSGSTLIAAHLEDFRAIGFEREEKWVDLARKRLASARAQQRMELE
jgi:hypothetical protein